MQGWALADDCRIIPVSAPLGAANNTPATSWHLASEAGQGLLSPLVDEKEIRKEWQETAGSGRWRSFVRMTRRAALASSFESGPIR